MLVKKLILPLLTLSVLSFGGCVSKQQEQEIQELKMENLKLKNELDASKIRINGMELFINELKDQLAAEKTLREEEISRVSQTYKGLMDDLQKEVTDGQIEIENIKGVLTLNIAETLFFDSGKAELKPEGEELLKRIGEILNKIPEKLVKVEGHTDNVPIGGKLKEKYHTNWELAAIRAVNVTRYLQDSAGVDPSRLSAVSYSEFQPVRKNTTVANRAKNRRIEIVLLDRHLYQIMETKKGLDSE